MTAIDNVYALPHLTAILVSGLDAENFLQSQLSSNVVALEQKAVQFSSWCAANGRVIALGWLYRTAEGFCWIVAADTADAVIIGLNKYRLRSKVAITRSDTVSGIDADGAAIGSESSLVGVRLADGRSLSCVSGDRCAPTPEDFLARWYLRDIELKIPWNGGAERFLPQMLGIERFAGLSLKKGCFPGQEVISRLHYKGVLKRNLRVLQFDHPIQTGRYTCSDASEEIEIIQAQGSRALAVVGNNLALNFSIRYKDHERICRTDDADFVDAL